MTASNLVLSLSSSSLSTFEPSSLLRPLTLARPSSEVTMFSVTEGRFSWGCSNGEYPSSSESMSVSPGSG